MGNYYEHLLAPDGNQEFARYIIDMFDDLNYGLVRIKVNGKNIRRNFAKRDRYSVR